jgi:hypothetical protein
MMQTMAQPGSERNFANALMRVKPMFKHGMYCDSQACRSSAQVV